MFEFLLWWLKASQCKKLIKRARCRLKLLKNKRLVIGRQLRQDVADLINNGHQHIALKRVEHVIRDESLAAAYELLDHYCEFVLTQLSYIRRHKDCPNDINEAVSSLIFASARCGDVPELCAIRKLFERRYGHKFAKTAVELFPGNFVNHQLKEKLPVKSVPNDLKCKVVDEIARDYCIQPKLLAIEYYPDWQQEPVKQNNRHPQLVEKDANLSFLSKSSNSCSLRGSSIVTNDSVMISGVQKCPPYILSEKNLEKVENFDHLNSITTCGLEMVDYVDKREVKRREHQKRTRRRSVLLKKQGIMDIGCMLYYYKPYKSFSDKRGAHCRRKHQKHLQEISKSSYAEKRSKKHSTSKCTKRRTSFNPNMNGCSLDHPCYLCDYDDKLCLGGIIATHVQQNILFGECCHWNEELHEPNKSDRKSDNGAAVYNVFTYPDWHIEEQNERKAEASESKNNKGNMLRAYSCPPYPKYVHPKLPDYDDFASKFTALKREYLQNQKIAAATNN